MAGRTPRFQFSFFGGDVEGSITDDGGKYTGLDRLDLDKILNLLETHDFHYHAVFDTSSQAPSVVRQETGALEGGKTYFYKVAILDQDGMEGAASAEVSISTPDILTAPEAPSGNVLDLGGNPGNGIFYYALTTIRGAEESTLGDIETVTVLAGDGSVELTLPTPVETDATSMRIWRMGSTDSGYTRVAVVAANVTTWTDDGSVPPDPCPTDPDNLPPTANAGTDIYSVLVTLNPADVAKLTSASGWAIYRTEVSGSYANSSLVHTVVEREDDLDPTSDLFTSWLDDGDELAAGAPKLNTQSLDLRPFVFEDHGALPPAGPYPNFYPIVVGTALYIKIGGDWEEITGGGGGGGGGGTVSTGSPWPDFIFTGSDGRRWQQTVDATGAIVMVETALPGAPTPPVVTP